MLPAWRRSRRRSPRRSTAWRRSSASSRTSCARNQSPLRLHRRVSLGTGCPGDGYLPRSTTRGKGRRRRTVRRKQPRRRHPYRAWLRVACRRWRWRGHVAASARIRSGRRLRSWRLGWSGSSPSSRRGRRLPRNRKPKSSNTISTTPLMTSSTTTWTRRRLPRRPTPSPMTCLRPASPRRSVSTRNSRRRYQRLRGIPTGHRRRRRGTATQATQGMPLKPRTRTTTSRCTRRPCVGTTRRSGPGTAPRMTSSRRGSRASPAPPRARGDLARWRRFAKSPRNR